MRISAAIALAGIALVVTGCASTTSGGGAYQASTQNIISIQGHAAKTKVKLEDFTAAAGVNDSTWCRAMGPLTIGGGKPPSQFIHDALQQELFMAGVYAVDAPVSISGRVEKLAYSSISPGNWQITLTLSSSTGASYQTEARFEFDTSWNAAMACKNTGDAFPMAVQETLKKAISDARFKALVGKN